jgi:hypothetical protein
VVTTTLKTYASQIETPAFIAMQPGQCYVAQVKLGLTQGNSISLRAVDTSGTTLFTQVISNHPSNTTQYTAQLRFLGTTGNAKLVISTYAALPQIVGFNIYDAANSTAFAPCP